MFIIYMLLQLILYILLEHILTQLKVRSSIQSTLMLNLLNCIRRGSEMNMIS